MALFLIIMMIIGIRVLGFGIRIFGRLLGLWITLIIFGAILSGIIGLTFRALPVLLVLAGIYWIIRYSGEERHTGSAGNDYRF